jgi:hypothetical protein
VSTKSTASQRQFIYSLAHKVSKDMFTECFNKAASLNSNAEYNGYETYTQASKRLSKDAASMLIKLLLEESKVK